MFVLQHYRRFRFFVLVAFFLSLVGPSLRAQTKQLLAWQKDLTYLQGASGEELAQNQVAVQQIRRGIEFYLKFHPLSKVVLPEAPLQPWGAAEQRKEVSALSQALESIMKEDPSRPFNLGATVVSVSAEVSALSPVTDSLGGKEIEQRQILTVAAALDHGCQLYLPQPHN